MKRRSPEEMETGALEILSAIADLKERRVADATERLVRRLAEDGGWELNYLPDGSLGTEGEIRALLSDWPSHSSDKPSLPTVDNVMSDLDALEDMLSDVNPLDAIPGFAKALQAELFAVLALVKLDDAARALHIPERRTVDGTVIWPGATPWEVGKVIEGASALIEAMELVCYAERELTDLQRKQLRDEAQERWDDEIRADTRRANARLGGLAKHAAASKAKAFIMTEWMAHRLAYGNNKSAFARDYVRRVKNELNVRVTEKQMREVWLSDTPSASKPDGQPASG